MEFPLTAFSPFPLAHSSADFAKSEELNKMACIRAFQHHRHDLAVVIEHLLNNLTCKDLLPESTKERAQLPNLSQTERSVVVLDAIEAQIMTNPEIFHIFVTVLQKDVVLQKFAGGIVESYRE